MNLASRPLHPPARLAAGTWTASVLAGGLLLVIGPTAPKPPIRGLVPATVVEHLERLLPAGAREPRVNGLYGSGHGGAWQFVAHLTWRQPDGQIAGGRTELPLVAGQPPLDIGFDTARLEHEQQIGWTLRDLGRVLARLPDADARLAFVEFVPDLDVRPAPIVYCAARVMVTCQDRDRTRLLRRHEEQLADEPLEGAVSVHLIGERPGG